MASLLEQGSAKCRKIYSRGNANFFSVDLGQDGGVAGFPLPVAAAGVWNGARFRSEYLPSIES